MKVGTLGAVWIAMVVGGVTAVRAEPEDVPVPAVVAAARSGSVELPPTPRFELPILDGGAHDVRELRVRGRALLDRELTVRGYVTWIYDCAKALAQPGVPAAETQLLIDDNPQLCEIPKFYLGSDPHTAPEVALWVVDVPRHANKRETIALREAQLLRRPPVPRIAIGDLVAVTGTFTRRSPHGEQNSDGVLVFKALVHVTPGPSPGARAVVAEPASVVAEAPALPKPSARAPIAMRWRNESIERYERCNQLLAQRHVEDAASECRRALERWSDNHLAWYALGNILATQDDWCAARDAYERAAALRPDAAMYQLYAGVAAYQIGDRKAAQDKAQLARCPSAAASDFERARSSLARAASLAPQLWLASYYLGKAALQQDLAGVAAQAFERAIRADPSQADPYTALLRLYRSWDFLDQGAVVARQANKSATSGDVARLFYEIGMAYEAKRDGVAAVAAFSRAAAAGNAPARFQRGQLYLRQGDLARAKLDLEAFLADPDAGSGFAPQVARSLLLTIAKRAARHDAYLRMPRHYDAQ